MRTARSHAPAIPLLRWFVWPVIAVLTLEPAAQVGAVRSKQKISETTGGFGGVLEAVDNFGSSVCSIGDLDGDGVGDLAVGAYGANDMGFDEGAVWILFMNAEGAVASERLINETSAGFGTDLDASDQFGSAVASLGDIDGDGITDLAVGAYHDSDNGPQKGAVWILFLNADGTVRSYQKINESSGGFGGDLDEEDRFGFAVASLGDLDGDGVTDLGVGAKFDDDGNGDAGAVWVLFLNADGTVASHQKISATQGGFGGSLDSSDQFGFSVAGVGDIDCDGIVDLAVGAVGDDDGGPARGAVWVLFLNTDGTVASQQKISATSGLGTVLDADDAFGSSVAAIGDLDGNGVEDLAVGAIGDDDGGSDHGALWILLLNLDGTVAFNQKISEMVSAFGGDLDDADNFGVSVSLLSDRGGSGRCELAVGAYQDDDGGFDQGAVWILFLDSAPQVLYERRIADGVGGLPSGTLAASDVFGESMASLGDLDGDGIVELAVGAPFDDDGGGGTSDRGAVYILFLARNGSVQTFQKISDTAGNFTGILDDGDVFGDAVTSFGDLDDDGVADLAVGAQYDDDEGTNRGAVWILFLNANGTVKSHQKISSGTGGFSGVLLDNDEFGGSLGAPGDVDGDGVEDLAVGAYRDQDGGANRGAVWILFLNANGTVKAQQKISDTAGGFLGALADNDQFGRSITSVGDLNQDEVGDLVVGASQDSQVGTWNGAVWVLLLASDGSVNQFNKITEGVGGFTGDLDDLDQFGLSAVSLGDMGGPGVVDVAIGASSDDDGASSTGAVWILSLDSNAEVVAQQKISDTSGGFAGNLAASDSLGLSVGALGDLDRDGRGDLAIGAYEQTSHAGAGAVWICYMNDGTLALGANATAWTGATDTQWELASNWGNGTPDATKTAIIPDATTTPNDPVISVTGQQCDSLWIQSGGSLAISAGMESLGVFGGATLSGPITGTGQLVLETAATLAGDATISLTFDPAVRADDDLELQGGPLAVTGNLQGLADVSVAALGDFDVGGDLVVTGDLALDGSLGVGNSVDVGETLSSSSSGSLETRGSGTCVVAGQLCFHGEVATSCSISVERLTADPTVFEIDGGWPAGVSIDVPGTVTLLTTQLEIGGDLVIEEGTFAVGVDGSIEAGGANGIVVKDGAILDIGGFQTLVLAPTPITVQAGGKLNIGAGGELLLESNVLTIESGGTLCLDGSVASSAALTGYLSSRYTLALNSGSILAAKNFAFRGMTAPGIVIGSGVTLAAAPLDLRAGVFDLPAPGGVLLDIVRSSPTQLRYLRFDNSQSAAGVKNVRTSLASSVLTLVNWSGSLASDAATAESFDDDPGESSPPERIVWAPPQASDVQDFTANWGSGFVRTSWQTLTEVDSQAFLVQRSPEPPGLIVNVGETPAVGASSYELRDYAFTAFAASRYRLYERLTHGALRPVGEVVLPASGIVLQLGGSAPAPPAPPGLPLVIGPDGRYPDVHTALVELALGGQSTPITLELARGTHAPFELGRGLAFDLCLVARPGAVIDAWRAPLRIEDLPAERSLELVNLAVDARRGLLPAVEIENSRGVVLFQDTRLRGNTSAPAVRLSDSTAVALQGGAIEGVLRLESRSRASTSSTGITAVELTGRSTLETRGVSTGAFVEPGSIWRAHAVAPRLTVSASTATLAADCSGLAWLGAAHGLGFKPSTRPLLEGLFLLEPTAYTAVGPMRQLLDGHASWHLDPLPPGLPVYLQAFALDPTSGRICFSDALRTAR